MPRPTRPRTLTITLAALPALALTACGLRDANHRTILGGSASFSELAHDAPAAAERHDPASVLGPDRGTWVPTVFAVPVDGTVHGPIRTRRLALTRATPRQKGLEPTLDSALDLNGAAGAQAAEGFIAPLAAGLDAALLPVSLALRPPPAATTSPRTLYKRYPDSAWLHGPAAVSTEPPSKPAASPAGPIPAQTGPTQAVPAGVTVEPL
jgi:hypothetical protein